MTTILNNTQAPIFKDTTLTATYSQGFNNVSPTIADLYIISNQENPLQWVNIGTEIPAVDNMGHSNPWIVVHYGDATVFNPHTLQTEVQTGFFLQQKYYVPLTQAWTTSRGYLTMTDTVGTPNYIASLTEGSDFFAYYMHPQFGAQKMWLPVQAQVIQSNAQHFDYYGDTTTYAQRIQSALSSTPTVAARCTGTEAVYSASITTYYYFCSASATSVSGDTRTYSSYVMHPRFCCFIKGKIKQEES